MATTSTTKRALTGQMKAAILLRSLGEDSAAEVMRHLDPRDIRKIGQYMAEISNISREEEEEVIKEFKTAAETGDVGFEGKEYIKSILTKALGQEKAKRILETIAKTSYPGIDSLKWLDPKAVADVIRTEHPQTIAVILAHLDADHGSEVLSRLPEFMRPDVALRLATMEDVQPEVLQHLSDVLQEAFRVGGPAGQALGGAQVVAEMLALVDKTVEEHILGKIADRDPALADNIRSLMFVFDDLVKVDDRSLQELLKEISKDDLPLALKAANEEVRLKFFRNMSSRAAQMLQEDMEARGPVKLSDAERAQQNILKLCRKLEGEGRLSVAEGGDELV
jgi:flagellar motor switch protein FliG